MTDRLKNKRANEGMTISAHREEVGKDKGRKWKVTRHMMRNPTK